jgi:hypothetical protein
MGKTRAIKKFASKAKEENHILQSNAANNKRGLSDHTYSTEMDCRSERIKRGKLMHNEDIYIQPQDSLNVGIDPSILNHVPVPPSCLRYSMSGHSKDTYQPHYYTAGRYGWYCTPGNQCLLDIKILYRPMHPQLLCCLVSQDQPEDYFALQDIKEGLWTTFAAHVNNT